MLLLALAACSDRGPALSVDLAAGEVLIVGAVAGDSDVALEVVSSSGEVVTARTSRAEHQAANVRVTGAGRWVVRAGPATVIRREVMAGDVCTQLDALLAGGWDQPGVEQPGADDARRTRSLVAVMPWADECTVNRVGGMDVGPSCARSGLSRAEAVAVHDEVQAAFRACHTGWDLEDASSGPARELIAERDGALRFARLRELAGGWQVSVGAIPEG